MGAYEQFIASKQTADAPTGFDCDVQIGPMFDFQAACVKWALKRGRAALFLDTGLGKTLCQVTWAQHVCEYTGGRVIIAAPLCVSQQTVEEAEKFGITVKYCRSDDEVDDGITITNYEMLEHFDLDDFVGVVLDECFPPDQTVQVLGLDNQVKDDYIANVKVGDTIFNASGFDNVKQTYKRRIDRAVYISVDGRNITCSENHPFFTVHGWKCAQDLCPGDYVMETSTAVRLVRDGVLSEISWDEDAAFLRDILLCEMADEHAGTQSEITQCGSCCETGQEHKRMVAREFTGGLGANGENIELESDAECGNEGEGIQYIAEDGAQTFRAWGKWARFDGPADDFEGCTVKRLDNGICFVTGPTHSGLSNRLQARLGELRKKNQHRSGRAVALQPEGCGCEEGRKAGFARVDSVEILEQGHPRLEKYRDADGLVYFYDIKATRHPSFSVNGLLVHNSSILKSYNGKMREFITSSFRATPYKLSCTATPSPNDFIELGNQSEFLGVMNSQEMLATFFTHDGGDTGKWRLKGHGKVKFWEWMATWAICIRNPSDLGFDGARYELPPINIVEHVVSGGDLSEGQLFAITAQTLTERRQAKRNSMDERIALAASIANSTDEPVIIWCHMNEESERLAKLINGAVEVTGSMPLEKKTSNVMDFTRGNARALVSKASICGYGMNLQHCNTMIFAGMDDSFEKYYQAVRRCHRFGQKRQVTVHIITAETEGAVKANIERKQAQANEMAEQMISKMREITTSQIKGACSNTAVYLPTIPMVIPAWLISQIGK